MESGRKRKGKKAVTRKMHWKHRSMEVASRVGVSKIDGVDF